MGELADRRKEAREVVVSFMLVYEDTQGKLLGYLRDLNMGGAQISGSKELAVGDFVVLSIALPGDLQGVVTDALILDARVARCIEVTDTPKDYEIGFEFLRVTPEQHEIIEKWLARYDFRRHAEDGA